MNCNWDLSVLYRDFDDPQIEADFDELKNLCEKAKTMLTDDHLSSLEKIPSSIRSTP